MVLRIYSDESRQSKDRFMVLAGIIIAEISLKTFNSTMSKYRKETKMFSELKWSKVSKAKLEEYKTFVDYFFALNNSGKLHFKSIIFDNHIVNHKKHNNGNKEIGFYKFYYQLYSLFGRNYYQTNKKIEEYNKFILHPDYRHTSYKLDELKQILNNGFQKKTKINHAPFVSIEPLKSHKSEVIQILDIILGAIGYVKNGYSILATSNPAKVELCDYITRNAGVKDLMSDTPYMQNRFSIWNFPLKK